MFRFALKTGVAAGSVYYTVDKGLWKSSDQSIELYKTISYNVTPYIKEASGQVPIEVPEILSAQQIKSLFIHYWNKGVQKTCVFIWHLPNYTFEYTVKGWEMLKSSAESNKVIVDSMTESKTDLKK